MPLENPLVSTTIPQVIDKLQTQNWKHAVQEGAPAWAVGGVLAVGLVVGHRMLRGYVRRRLDMRPAQQQRGFLLWVGALLEGLRLWYLAVVGIYTAIRLMPQAAAIVEAVHYVFVLLSFLQLGFLISVVIEQVTRAYVSRIGRGNGARITMTNTMVTIGKVLIWLLVLMLMLSNVGVDITALVAGLGIGGLAMALAAKGLVEDIFGSLSIVFDRPFVIGDFIIAGDITGTVEQIGLKTARIRGMTGEQIVVSNKDLLNSRIRNYGRMFERSVIFVFGVQYGTRSALLESIPTRIKKIIESQPSTRFERAHIARYGPAGIDVEVAYFVLSPYYTTYMDVQQAINLAIYKSFEKLGISFAAPLLPPPQPLPPQPQGPIA